MAEPQPTIDPPVPSMAALYLSLGRAVSVWGILEQQLMEWFSIVSRIPMAMANDVFFAPNSFASRLSLLQAALENSKANEQEREFARAIMNKAEQYSKFRNRCVHAGRPMMNAMDAIPRLLDSYGQTNKEKYDRGITAAQLDQAALNFKALIEIMLEARTMRYFRRMRLRALQTTTLPALLRRVEQLPNVAESSELSRHQRGRLRQQLAAQRKLPGKKSTRRGPQTST